MRPCGTKDSDHQIKILPKLTKSQFTKVTYYNMTEPMTIFTAWERNLFYYCNTSVAGLGEIFQLYDNVIAQFHHTDHVV